MHGRLPALGCKKNHAESGVQYKPCFQWQFQSTKRRFIRRRIPSFPYYHARHPPRPIDRAAERAAYPHARRQMNQDSRRKLKQVYHLYQFIEPLLQEVQEAHAGVQLGDHGAGKSYLGCILYDLFFKALQDDSHIYSIETRDELVSRSQELAKRLGFERMSFLNLSVAESIESALLPKRIDVVTALHACNTATDDAIRFALKKQAKFVVLVPCCQAEVAAVLRKNKGKALKSPLTEIWRHPLHTREFGSQVTNVLRCLQ